MKVLQRLCFERARHVPNERLLTAMDRLILSAGPSAKLAIGKGAILSNRYGDTVLRPGPGAGATAAQQAQGPAKTRRETDTVRLHGPGRYRVALGTGKAEGDTSALSTSIVWEDKGHVPASRARTLAAGERAALFARGELRLPLGVRPLRAGDRIRPFGLAAGKKVKEVLIDRKVPREERWGRPVVCDAQGEILWIPGVLRSAHAPVDARTRETLLLRMEESGPPDAGGEASLGRLLAEEEAEIRSGRVRPARDAVAGVRRRGRG